MIVTTLLLAVLLGPLGPAAAQAKPKELELSWNWRRLELQPLVSLGGPVGLVARAPDNASTLPFTGRAGARVRSTRYLNFGLELSLVVPSGLGANLVLDAVKNDRFRLHVIDLGLFWNAWTPVSVSDLKRGLDVTFGAGADIRINTYWTLLVDWRCFLPDPEYYVFHWGDFSIPIYKEAFQGGQLWVGVAYSWPALR